MSFFDSTVVQDEAEYTRKLIKRFAELQIVITLSEEEIRSWVNDMEELLDKTKIFFTRLGLSDDKEAQEIKHKADIYAKLIGKNYFMEALDEVQIVINEVKNQLDKQ